MKILGDIVIVEHIKDNWDSRLIWIPNAVKNRFGGICAKVIALGFVPPHRRKKKKYYPQDELKVGDVVVVPEHFGTRGRACKILNNENAIIYDGEDVLAIVTA